MIFIDQSRSFSDLQRFEQHAPEYLAINPNGVVPSLVVNGRPVVESSIIIEFIDQEAVQPKD